MGRLDFLCLPLGAVWRQRPAVAHAVLKTISSAQGCPGFTGGAEHDATACFVLVGSLSAGFAAGARCPRGGNASGYVADSICVVGAGSMTSHSDITGDFNSAYTVKSTSHSEHGPPGLPRDFTATIEAKWVGACK